MNTLTNITPREENNSAIGSWAGYIYQGLCALYHTLTLIKQNKNTYNDYMLSLDSFEDFAIINNQKQIESLHQCKDEKAIKNYDHEFRKMIKKKDTLQKNKLMASNYELYLHCNNNIATPGTIKLYSYGADKNTCAPNEIYPLIRDIIEIIKPSDSSLDYIVCKLTSLIEEKILEVQKQYFSSKEKLRDIARQYAFISFKDINDIIFNPPIIGLDKKEFISYIRLQYILGLHLYMEEEENLYNSKVNKESINIFIASLSSMSQTDLNNLIQRINPREHVEANLQSLQNICTKDRIRYLFNQLNTLTPLESSLLHWGDKGNKQTPSTLGGNKRLNRDICLDIYRNAPNLDILWTYNWIVGDVDESVENIKNAIPIIQNLPIDEYTNSETPNIFQTKNVGILTIEDKQNGNFN